MEKERERERANYWIDIQLPQFASHTDNLRQYSKLYAILYIEVSRAKCLIYKGNVEEMEYFD